MSAVLRRVRPDIVYMHAPKGAMKAQCGALLAGDPRRVHTVQGMDFPASRFTVQRGDSTEVRIPRDFTYVGIGSAARPMMQSGSVPYTVTGDVIVATPLGNFTRPYTGHGRFSAFGGASRQ